VRRLLPWLVVAATVALAGWGLDAAGVPSAWLFGALLLGLAAALLLPGRLAVPERGFTAAQAVTGVTLGTYLQSSALSALGHDWLAVALVSAATLVVSLAAGLALSKVTSLDAPTAALGMIAGGASGIVTMARELEGDDRLVAFMQYARVLVVVLLTPVLIPILFPGHHGVSAASASGGAPVLGSAVNWLLTPAIAGAAGWAAVRARMPAGALLGPMIVAGAITLSGLDESLVTPPLLREAAFAVIGLQVGLRFTIATLRQVGRLLIPVLLSILFLLVACFGLAAVLAATTSVTLEDAYLATTPGGLYAVLAVAFGAGANTTFIVAVQGLRVLVMVLLAPLAVRLILGRPVAVAR
jgi:membrane AbrB-like protein